MTNSKHRIDHRVDPRLDSANNPACAKVDPELFYPTGREDMWNGAHVAAAKAVCGRCPVLGKCRVWAIGSKQAHGILGGQTPKERKATAARERAEREQAERDQAADNAEAARLALLAQLEQERDGDTANLWREMVHPPMAIAGWVK